MGPDYAKSYRGIFEKKFFNYLIEGITKEIRR